MLFVFWADTVWMKRENIKIGLFICYAVAVQYHVNAYLHIFRDNCYLGIW